MEFGKIYDLSAVNFDLPLDPNRTLEILQKAKETSQKKPSVYVGCTGWGMPQWVGDIYPKGAKAKEFLYYYTRQFNTIELNTTHYRIPTADTIRTWYNESKEDFKFCPKLPQGISHSRDLGISSGQIALFCSMVEGLSEKLGCCFMQLPPHFSVNYLGVLEKFLLQFPSTIPLAIEVRHESFFQKLSQTNVNAQRYFDILEQYNVSSVITDVAGRRDVLHQCLTTPTAMIRFVGNDLHPSDYTRIDAWVEKLNDWFAQGLETLYFFTHEPDNLRAPILADYLLKKLSQNANLSQIRFPNFITQQTPAPKQGQMALF